MTLSDLHEMLSLSPGTLVAVGLAAARIGGVVAVLPVLATVPWRGRIAISLVLGVTLASRQGDAIAEWSIAGLVSELLTGISLGIGLRVILSALQTAGTWIDEQTSTGLTSEATLTESDENTQGSAQVLTWIGAWLLLNSSPWGADLAVMERALESLQYIPLGTLLSPDQVPTWIVGLLRGWSELAIGVALPICLVAALIQAGLTLIGRGLGIGLGPAMSPLRAGLTCLLLLIVLPSQAHQIEQTSVMNFPPVVSDSSTLEESPP